MMNTNESINGDFKIPCTPGSVPRNNPFAGPTKAIIPTRITNAAIPANFNPRFSSFVTVIEFSSTVASPL